MNEELIKEWDFSMNGDVDPRLIADHSNKKYYWICPKGHPSYLAPVSKRSYGYGCPVCSNHKIISGINDFAFLNPELMKEWYWQENEKEGNDPTTVSEGSGMMAWWKCQKCSNTWKASIVNRTKKHSGCPYCANLKVKKGFNDLKTKRPDLAEEWDYDKNTSIKPDEIPEFYAKKVWWKCKEGHSWQATPNNRSRTGCPYCAKIAIARGVNDFASENPELLLEWDFAKNKCDPYKIARGSEKKVWWKCKEGHSWQAIVNSRVRGRGCPYCTNKKVLVGYNDLFTTRPELKDEWDYELNKNVSPLKVTAGSNKKVWWKCKYCGKSWQAIIYARKNGNGCPDCSAIRGAQIRLQTMASKNPLFEHFPDLRDEWDDEKNKKIDISTLTVFSNKEVWWKCKKGHSFKCSITSRTSRNVGCPYCHGQKVLTGENDLQTLNPKLAEEWDYEKNYPLTPSDVFSCADKHVWWKCQICGNSWKAKINNRAHGRGCPACNNNGTSFVEQTLFYYVKKIYPNAENRYMLDGTELDIFIPELNVAIEYDGAFYHSIKGSDEREAKKDIFCKENGIKLIRLREKPLEHTDNAINLSCDCTSWNSLEDTSRDLLKYLNISENVDISIKRDYEAILQSKVSLIKENAFGKSHPELLLEWDYEKNTPLLPDYFSSGSSVKVWWKCKEGHSWQTTISNRCRGSGCKECYNLRRAKRKN